MNVQNLLSRRIVGSAALVGLIATATVASAAQITITDAKIAAGKLVVTGKSSQANARLRLDRKSGAGFNVTSKADKTFSFGVVYLPKDCIVSVQEVLPTARMGDSTDLVVANCAPAGISPRGTWSRGLVYEANDLVAFGGSSWLAVQDNINAKPGAAGDWQLFAARGGDGSAGGAGSNGSAGSAGAVGIMADTRTLPTGAAGGDLAGTYPNPRIRAGAVGSAKIKNLAVTREKIAAGAITSDKVLDYNQVGGGLNEDDINELHGDYNIQDGTISFYDIGDDQIFSRHVADDSLAAADLAPSSVGDSELDPTAFFAGDIAFDGSQYQIPAGGVDSSDIGANAVGASELGTINERSSGGVFIPAGTVGTATVNCLNSEQVISGGYEVSNGFVTLMSSFRKINGWNVTVFNTLTAGQSFTVYAYCLG